MSEVTFVFGMGDEVKDQITGFQGIVITQLRWFTGCNRYNVQSKKLGKDGEPGTLEGFDEISLRLIKAGAVKLIPPEIHTPPGGPRNDPKSSVRTVNERH